MRGDGGVLRFALIALLLLPGGTCIASGLAGTVRLSLDGKPLRAEEARDAVVYFRPTVQVRPPLPATPFEMRMERKQFQPRALPIPVGASVLFRNVDPILHNAFAPRGTHEFDVGLYGEGEGREHVFTRAGLVRVYCNVHHDMVGHVLVLDTPYFTRPDGAGRFELQVDAPVAGELFVWHERARLWRRKVQAGDDLSFEVDLDLSRPRVPPHMNKFGKPYGGQRSGY